MYLNHSSISYLENLSDDGNLTVEPTTKCSFVVDFNEITPLKSVGNKTKVQEEFCDVLVHSFTSTPCEPTVQEAEEKFTCQQYCIVNSVQ
jgi:hypothetical protein